MNHTDNTYTFSIPPMPVTEHIAPQSEEDDKSAAETLSDQWMATPDFPAVGTRLRFTKDGYSFCNTAKKGDEITVLRHTGYGFVTSVVGLPDGEEWIFGKLWRDGLEIVPPLPTPPVRPEGVKEVPKGAIFIGLGPFRQSPRYMWSGSSDGIWREYPAGNSPTSYYADEIGGPAHRAQPWFHESQVVAGEKSVDEQIGAKAKANLAAGLTPLGEARPTYPPDESEWPEKPDAGDGMRWARVKDGDHVEADVKIITLKTDRSGKPDHWYEWETAFGGHSFSWMTRNVFRAVPAPQWRELGVEDKDEVITEDHQLSYIGNEPNLGWIAASSLVGCVGRRFSDEMEGFRVRTKLPRPLPPSDVVDPVSGVTVPAELLPLPVAPKGKIAVARGWGWDSKLDVIYTRKSRKDLTKWDGWAPTPQTTLADEDAFYFEAIAPPAERKAREWTIHRGFWGVESHAQGPVPSLGETVRVREVLDGKEGA